MWILRDATQPTAVITQGSGLLPAAVMNPRTTVSLIGKGLILPTHRDHRPPLRKVSPGTEAGAEAGTMEEAVYQLALQWPQLSYIPRTTCAGVAPPKVGGALPY